MPVEQPDIVTTLSSPASISTVIQPPAALSMVMGGVQSIAVTVQPPTTYLTTLQVGQGPAGPAPVIDQGSYGTFYDLTDQPATLANTPQRINLGVTDGHYGISVIDGGKVLFPKAGVYSFTFSIQFINTHNNEQHSATVWLKQNGVPVPDSSSRFDIHGAKGSTHGADVGTVNFIVDVLAGDYIEVFWMADDTRLGVITYEYSGDVPHSPSIIVTVQQVLNVEAPTYSPEVPILGKSLEYSGDQLVAVSMFSDIAKTTLVERRELHYLLDGTLGHIDYFNGSLVLQKTTTLTYSAGKLVGTVTT